jgi:L-cystine transport system permease protein
LANLKIFEEALAIIVSAVPITLFITVASLFLGTAAALLLSYLKIKKTRFFSTLGNVFISFCRGTPLLIQLFLTYYIFPAFLEQLGFKIPNSNMIVFAIIPLGLNCSAYLAEIIRASFLGVEKGQTEAALSVGLSNFQMFRRVLFPQAFKIALPNFGSLVIDLLKDSSLAFSIGVVDLMGKARVLSAANYGIFQTQSYLAAALMYWLMCLALERGIALLEKKQGRGSAEIGSVKA